MADSKSIERYDISMKFRKEFILKDVAGSKLVVSLDSETVDFNKMMTLNETGVFLWEQLGTCETEDDLIKKLTNEYEVSDENARRDIANFLSELRKHEIIY